MRSLISIDFPAPEMEPESAHVVSEGTWSQNQDTRCSNYGLILSLPLEIKHPRMRSKKVTFYVQ